MKRNFPVPTQEKQKIYESFCKEMICSESGKNEIPDICGYYGRACRKMNKEANSMLCNGCTLYKFIVTVQAILKRCDEKERIGIKSLYDSDIMDIENILDQEGIKDADYSYIRSILDFLTK